LKIDFFVVKLLSVFIDHTLCHAQDAVRYVIYKHKEKDQKELVAIGRFSEVVIV